MSLVTTAEVKAFCSSLNSATYTTAIGVQIPIVEQWITEYCNNHFTKFEEGYKDDYTFFDGSDITFANSGKTITDDNADLNFVTDHKFATGDNIYIKGTRKNDGHFTISNVTDTVITVSEDLVDEDTDEDYLVYFFLVNWPKSLKMIAAQMIEYDILRRFNTDKNIKSEKIGDYSVSFGSGMSYPKEIIMNLVTYRKLSCQ